MKLSHDAKETALDDEDFHHTRNVFGDKRNVFLKPQPIFVNNLNTRSIEYSKLINSIKKPGYVSKLTRQAPNQEEITRNEKSTRKRNIKTGRKHTTFYCR